VSKSEKQYKKFDFFYRRTAFRSMTEFYKGLFKPSLDKWREGEKKSTKNFLHNHVSNDLLNNSELNNILVKNQINLDNSKSSV